MKIDAFILCFNEARQVPIHFIGSIAHFSEDIIRTILVSYGLQLGAIVRRPIDGMIEYFRNEIINRLR